MVPSTYLRTVLRNLGVTDRPICVVEPGLAEPNRRVAGGPTGTHAIMVCALTEPKGVLALLRALHEELQDGDRLRLRIVGDVTADVEYARRCELLVQVSPKLRRAVTFVGQLPHEQLLKELAQSNLFLSASRMESYGMALAEAHSLGIPIIARRGGNVAAHVLVEHGGAFVDDEHAVAEDCVKLCRNRGERERRGSLALAAQFKRQTWPEAAQALLADLGLAGAERSRD
jgi:glycosyltransferase involved in cell wall biosynthesis